jgi:hypothetical protein
VLVPLPLDVLPVDVVLLEEDVEVVVDVAEVVLVEPMARDPIVCEAS